MWARSSIAISGAISLLLAAVAHSKPLDTPLKIAAASDLALAFRDVGAAFEARSGQKLVYSFGSTGLMAPLINGGKIRGLAVTGNKRSHALPDVPALAEQGFPGFSALAWWGIVTPAGAPRPVIDKMHAELVKVFNQPDVRKQLTETMGMELVVSSPDALQKFLVAEMARWGKVVREHGIKPD